VGHDLDGGDDNSIIVVVDLGDELDENPQEQKCEMGASLFKSSAARAGD
jgi:hypothetical protein